MSEASKPPRRASPAERVGEKAPVPPKATRAKEIGGPPGPEPTRYGDWERNGRCVDF